MQAKGICMAVVAAVCWGLVANTGEFLVTVKGLDAVALTSLRLMAAADFLVSKRVLSYKKVRSSQTNRYAL